MSAPRETKAELAKQIRRLNRKLRRLESDLVLYQELADEAIRRFQEVYRLNHDDLKAAVEAEREACAKHVEWASLDWVDGDPRKNIAIGIRERGLAHRARGAR